MKTHVYAGLIVLMTSLHVCAGYVSATTVAHKSAIIKAELAIPVDHWTFITVVCDSTQVELNYLVMGKISQVRQDFFGTITFHIDDQDIRSRGKVYRHDINYAGFNITDQRSIHRILEGMLHTQQPVYAIEDHGATSVVKSMTLSSPLKKSIQQLTLACGTPEQ